MDNAEFKALVTALEENPDALHALLCEDCDHPALEGVLSDGARAFAMSLTPERRLDLAFLKNRNDDLARRDALAGCVDSCEASRFGGGDFVRPPSTGPGDGFGSGCVATCEATCGNITCAAGTVIQPLDRWDPDGRDLFAACGGNTTCSCTTGTCGGATCGGSTCSVTCTGDSCGNTCGDSCGYTTNLEQPLNLSQPWLMQRLRWR